MSSEQELKDRIEELEEEKQFLQIMLDNNADHASSLEEQLSAQVDSIERLRDRMKVYLSPQIYESITHEIESESFNPSSQGDQKVERPLSFNRKKLVIFFSDIVGFTALTDSIESEQLHEMLNAYLDRMAVTALKYGGTIDKFIGDAVMVFFGDPIFTDDATHAVSCVKMALEMQNQLLLLNDLWRRELGINQSMQIRVGINVGYCTVGDFGSKNRMDYTAIGGGVNIAARLESLAQPNEIFISSGVYMLVKDSVECKYVGDIQVKGVHHPVQVYQALKVKSPDNNTIDFFQRMEDGFLLNQVKYDGQNLSLDDLEQVKVSLCEAVRFVEDALEDRRQKIQHTKQEH